MTHLATPPHNRFMSARWRHVWFAIVPVLLAAFLVVPGSHDVALAAVGTPTKYVAVDPFRLVDTRTDLGVTRVNANTWRVRATGGNGVPANADAVAVSIVATEATRAGHMLVFPTGEAMPNASNLNYQPGQTYSTGAIIRLGASGQFDIYTLNPVEIVIDVTGAFVDATSATSGRFVPEPPRRLLDTRSTAPLAPGGTTTITMPTSVPTDSIAAIVTLTSASPNVPGFFTAYAERTLPNTSTLNVSAANSVRATTAIVPLLDRKLTVYSSHGGTLIVDLIGYFTGPSAPSTAEGLYVPMSPVRQLDTRDSTSLAPNESRSFLTTGGGAAVGSLAMIQNGQPGFGAVFSNGSAYPGTSSINLQDVPVIANMAVSRTSTAGVNIFSSTDAHYIFDQVGYFTSPSAPISVPVTPSTPPPRPTVPSGQCAVSSLLVPSCGAWFGASTPSRNGSYDYTAGLVEYEAVAQNTPDILHFYKNGNARFPTADEIRASERPGKQRSLLLYNWKPSTQTWRDIANGSADANIATVASSLKAYPHKLFLTIYHEPEDNVNPSAGSGMTATDYAAMYRHVVTRLRELGVTNTVFVWNPMGYYGWRQYLDDLYPGHEYVDWMCYDPYAKSDQTENLAVLTNNVRNDIGWPGFYNWATAKAPGKPIMMCEWGVDLLTNSNPAAVLAGDPAQLLSSYPMLKALVYWNNIDQVNARIDETSAKGTAYGAAYRQLANRSYFNATSPNAAP